MGFNTVVWSNELDDLGYLMVSPILGNPQALLDKVMIIHWNRVVTMAPYITIQPFWLKCVGSRGAFTPAFPPDAWSLRAPFRAPQKRSRRLFEHGSRFCASPAPLRLSSPLLRGVAGSLCRQSSFLLELPALPAQPAAPERFAPGPRRIPAIPRPPRAPLADPATQCTMGMPRLAPLPSAPLLRLHVPMLPAQSFAHMPGAVAQAPT